MQIGVPKEIKSDEHRVGLIPSSVRELVALGHTVWVEQQAGSGIGFSDEDYVDVGAHIVPDAPTLFSKGQLIVKVKEPQPSECALLSADHVLFTFLHLAPDLKQADGLIQSGCAAIAYETVTDAQGRLPLLSPMSAVAGRLSVQVGAQCLEKPKGGRGILLGGVAGVRGGMVTIIGGGVVGSNAVRMAIGLESKVTVLDQSIARLEELDAQFGAKLDTQFASRFNLEKCLGESDLVVGAVLVPGGAAPKLIERSHLALMKPGSVIVDVAIDQGGCLETARPTTHEAPTFVVDDVIHYCVANMPGAVPRTASIALNNATLPYVVRLAEQGLAVLKDDVGLRAGLNVDRGQVTHQSVAEALGKSYVPAEEALASRGL